MSQSTLTRTLDFEPLEDRLLFSATPAGAVDVPDKPTGADSGGQESGTHSNTAEATPDLDANAVSAANTAEAASAEETPTTVATPDADAAVTPDVVNATESPRHELIVLDLRVANAESVAESLMVNATAGVQFDVIYLDNTTSGLDQVLQAMAASGNPSFDAIHLITHADSGRVFMGSTPLTTAALTSDAAVQESLNQWKTYLTEEADVLFYGCDLAEGASGAAFVNQFAALTGADVAASTDVTGSASRGGDWTLEMASGAIEATALSSTLDMALDPVPQITVNAPEFSDGGNATTPMVGEAFEVAINFENTGPDVGYGPFVDLRISPGATLVGAPGTAFTYLGETVTVLYSFVNNTVAAVTIPHPIPELAAAGHTITIEVGEEYYVLELPFGSFASGQPGATILFNAISDRYEYPADFTPLSQTPIERGSISFSVGGGFRFGATPVAEASGDDPIYTGPATALASQDGNATTDPVGTDEIRPRIWEVTTDVLEQENEAATGSNDPQTWQIFVDIATNESIANIVISDTIAENLQYLGNLTILDSNGAAINPANYTVNLTGEGNPGASLQITFTGSVTGVAGNDITISYDTYVPYLDSLGALVLNDNAGAPVSIVNSVVATGNWFANPGFVAVTDSAVGDPGELPNFDTLSAESITIHKTVTNDSMGGNTDNFIPGNVLNWNLLIQVSDYFQFDDLYVLDKMGDGQQFINSTGAVVAGVTAPTFQWWEEGVMQTLNFSISSPSADLSALADVALINFGNLVVFYNGSGSVQTFDASVYQASAPNNVSVGIGETVLLFKISAQMDAVDGVGGIDGILKGDGLDGGNLAGSDNATRNTEMLANIGEGQTRAVINFKSVVQETYVRPVVPGLNNNIDMGDSIGNDVAVNGLIRDNNTNTIESRVDETSGDGLVVTGPSISKTLAYINDAAPGASDNMVAAGGTVTWGLNTTLSTADTERLTITDYVPLPKFEVGEFGAGPNIIGQVTVYSASGFALLSPTDKIPDAGEIFVVLGDDVFATLNGGVLLNSVAGSAILQSATIDAGTNSFSINVGTFGLPAAQAALSANRLVQVFFTLTATDVAMVDGLYLTNQQRTTYQNTNAVSSAGDRIVQVRIADPVLKLYKGVVSDATGAGLTVGGVTFGAGGITAGAVTSTAIATAIDSQNLTGVDAGDVVKFALVVENTGRADAYDVKISDTIPDNFGIPVNFVVQRGDGTVVPATDYTVVITGNNFEITFTDVNRDADPAIEGSVGAGKDAAGTALATGANYLVITYDATLLTAAQSGSSLTNQAAIVEYVGTDGGMSTPTNNRVSTPVITDAVVILSTPELDKNLTNSIIATGNTLTQAVIGEVLTYQLIITLTEGTTFGSTITDLLDAGLAFVQVTGFEYQINTAATPGVFVDGSAFITSNTIGTGTGPSLGTGPANVTLSGNNVIFNLGNIANSNTDNATTERIVITYQAVVLNVQTNQATTQLDNSARLAYSSVGQVGDTNTASTNLNTALVSAPAVTVVEPHVGIEKAVSRDNATYDNTSLSNLDAGDTVYYRIRLTVAGGTPTAYDITLTDQLPFFLTGSTVFSVTGGGLATGDFGISGGNLLTLNTAGVDLAAGTTVDIVIQGTLTTATTPSTTISNNAVVKWSSLDGTVANVSIHNAASDERDGSEVTPTGNTDSSTLNGIADPVNNYGHSDQADVLTAGYGTQKTIVSTSVSSSNGSDVVVGEVVRYRLVVWLPEGTSSNFQIEDNLPTGLIFLNDGSARYAFVANSAGQITSTAATNVLALDPSTHLIVGNPTVGAGYDAFIAGIASGDLTGVFADENISTSPTNVGTGDTYSSGTNVFFRLGNLVNSGNDAGLEMVIIEFNALVANVSTNQIAQSLANNIRVLADKDSNGTPGYQSLDNNRDGDRSDAGETSTDPDDNWSTTAGQTAATSTDVTVVVREPVLTVLKTILIAPVDAGDPIQYQITISNPATANGQTAYEVTLADAIDSDLVVTAGTIATFSVTGGATVSAGAFEIAETSPGVFVLRTAAGADIDIPNGGSITLTFDATVRNDAPPSTVVTNQADVRWTSLPGGLDGDDAGSTTSERTGQGVSTPPQSANPADQTGPIDNYALSSTVTTQTLNSIVATKVVETTSLGSDTLLVTPGEIVTYRITVTVPEGSTADLQIRDAIPAGMAYVPGSLVLNSTGFVGSVAGPAVNPQSGVVYDNDTDIVFDFAAIVATANNIAGDNTFFFTYQTVVLAVAVNDGVLPVQNVLTNTATHNNGGADATFGTSAGSASVTVVEPDLNVVNSLNITGPNDAGAPFTYTITVSPTVNATSGAYEINLADILPAEFGSLSLNSAVISDGATNTSVLGSFLLSGNSLSTTGSVTLLLNTNGTADQVLTLTFTGVLTASVNPGETVNTTTSLAYTNYPGNQTAAGGFDPNPTVTTDHERSYVDTDTESFTAPLATFSKSLVATSEGFTTGSNVAIGETVTYALLVTLPEGTTPDLSIVDRLPAGLQYLSSSIVTTQVGSYGLLAADFAGTLPVPAFAGGATDGADVSFTFGSIAVSGDNAANSNSFVILITARVLNVEGNQSTTPLNNDATFDITGDGQAVFTSALVPITVVEPLVQVTQVVTSSTAGLDAGDTVTYSVTINNLASNGATTNAYDVSLSDVLPAGMLITGINAPTLSGGAIADTALSGTGTNTLTGIFDIPLNGSVTFTFTAVIPNTVTPGQSLNADINVHYTSLDGASVNERDGSGIADPETNTAQSVNLPVNNYAAGADTPVTVVNPFTVDKTVTNTSLGNDTSLSVVIGEVVTYQLAVGVMEGTTQLISIIDTLPSGLTYVPGSAVITNANGMTITGFAVNVAGQVLTLTATSVVNPGNADAAGTTDTDSFFITYQVQVANAAGNQTGTPLINDADATATGVTPDNNNQVTITVAEPALSLVKTTVTPGSDAGDTVVYTLVISNASSASGASTAYDINVTDLLDTDIALISALIGAGEGIQVSGATVSANTSTTGQLSLRLESLAAGGSATITLTARVIATAEAGSTVTNSASINWSSLPSGHPHEAGERDGDGGNGGLDDHTTSSTSANFVLAQPAIDKLTPADTTYAIGEIVTYDILVTLPEGNVSDLVISDFLPSGLVYTGFQVITTSAASGGLLAFDFGGTVSGSPTVANPSANTRTFDFGDVLVTNDNNVGGANNTFLLKVTARVDNILANQGLNSVPTAGTGAATTFSNTASLSYTDGTLGANRVVTDPTAPGAITVVEPIVSLDKTIVTTSTGSTTNLDAGDTVQYQIAFGNAAGATSPAYDVILSDTLPAGLLVTLIDSVTALGGAPALTITDFVITGGGTGIALRAGLQGSLDLAAGQGYEVRYTVTLQNSVTPGTNFNNSASITWTSMDGANANERSGTGSNLQNDNSVDDYRLTDTEQITTAAVFDLAKTADKTTATIGEVITYTLTLALNEGTTNNVQLVDTLPVSAGNLQLEYIGNPTLNFGTTGSTASGSATPTVSGANNQILTFALGTVVIPPGVDGNTVTLTYQVRVIDVANNATGSNLINSVNGSATGVTPDVDNNPAVDDTNNDVTVTVVEPHLVVTKSNNDADKLVYPGQLVTYSVLVTNTGNATAYDVLLRDAVPTGMVYVGSLTSTLPGTLTETGGVITARFDSLAVGASVTVEFQVRVLTSAAAGSNFDNNARVYYDSLAADDRNTIDPEDLVGGDGPDRDYGATVGVIEAPTPSPNDDAQDTDRLTIGTGSISDLVWFDVNGDGLSAGEEGIGGVTVQLYAADGITLLATTTTDANGLYAFNNLADGTFITRVVTASLPDALTTVTTFDLDGIGTAHQATVVLATSTTNRTDVDFGYRGTGSIGDTIYFDANQDGNQDAGEVGISGVTVTLTWAGADGAFGGVDDITLTTTTGATGTYGFTNLFSGNYRVDVGALPGGFNPDPTDGTPGTNVSVGVDAYDTTLAVGQTNNAVDFGYIGTGALGNRIYHDTNANGSFDAGDLGRDGIQVTLTWHGQDGTLGNADDVTFTTVTAGGGFYLFSGLPAGSYSIQVDAAGLPTGINTPTVGALGTDVSVGGTSAVITGATALGAGETRNTLDFGYTGVLTLGDLVFHDADADGIRDVGELGLVGIDLTLTWAGLDGDFSTVADNVVYTTTTGAGGAYLFSNLAPGNYRLNVDDADLPAGLVTLTNGADSVGTDPFEILNLTTSRSNVDFGYTGTTGTTGTVGDRVWYDVNGNGTQDAGEIGLAGVNIVLTWAGLDGDLSTLGDNVTYNTTTGADGFYSITNLPLDLVPGGIDTGLYSIQIVTATLPAGFDVRTFDQDGTGTPDTTTFSLVASRADIDFGYRGSAQIGDRVYHDVDNNGSFNAGDQALAGVTVTLTWFGQDGVLGGGDDVVVNTLTDATGNYVFAGLPDGNFNVTVNTATLPNGINAVTSGGTGADVSVGANSVNRTLAGGVSNNAVDFGYRGTSRIGDFIFHDADGDGVQDAGEHGLAGVDVTLTWWGLDGVRGNADDLVYTTTTNAAGGYSFINLASGSFTVDVDQTDLPAGLNVLTNGAGSVGSDPFNLTGATALGIGENRTTVDFGYRGTGSVGDRVWYDINGNGVQDANEPGLSEVTVRLTWAGLDGVLATTGDNVIYTAVTTSEGGYFFNFLPGDLPGGVNTGFFAVEVISSTLPAGAVPTYDQDGIGTEHLTVFTLLMGESRQDMDFGYRGSASIGDRVWNDQDRDGIVDGNERGIPNVRLSLFWDANGNGALDGNERASALMTTTTDSNGNYAFANLFGGGYFLAVDPTSLPPQYSATFDYDGVASLHTAGAKLANGSRFDLDFGYSDPRALLRTSSVFQVPAGLFGISYSTLTTYFMMDEEDNLDPWILPEWELVDSVQIFSSPMLSGHAEPGSKVVLALYNHRGELVSTSTVLVGSGGNWTVGFAGVEVNGPISIESSVTAGDFTAFNGDDNFNYRTNYISGMAGGYFQSRLQGIDDAFSGLAYERMSAMVGGDESTESIEGWKKNDYEFLSAPALPGQ